jgi:hypothetical protein
LTAALAAAFPFVAQAIPVQINLTNDGLPLIPPAVAYTMGEFDTLNLSFTVTNNNGQPITLSILLASQVPQGPDNSDAIVALNRGGNCASGVLLPAGGSCTVTFAMQSDRDTTPENMDFGRTLVTLRAGETAATQTTVDFIVQVDDVAEPASLGILGAALVGISLVRHWRLPGRSRRAGLEGATHDLALRTRVRDLLGSP